jgi:adenosylmethionine---8-amino-7-oxononanoate aminotransferase
LSGISSMNDNDEKRCLSPVWPPFTPLKGMPEPLQVRSGSGVFLELSDGRRLMDCISSWWVTLHGHCRQEIAKAIYNQALKLEQVIYAGLTHEPAEELARRLLALLPKGFTRLFYSDDGSTSVEVALKMAFQYWKNLGIKGRNRFLAFEGAYHGDTLGAMSVGQRSVFTRAFKEVLLDVDFLPYPETWLNDSAVSVKEEKSLAVIDNLLAKNPQSYAALIIEPLVQGAGGMRMCRPQFLRSLHDCLKKYDIPIIYDEVMVGFGRTGDFFACRKAQTTPDILCLSKGITGGFMPLGATVCTEKIFNAFYDEDPYKTFYHGHSYTANPLGCAAGIASLDLLEKEKRRFMGMQAWHERGMALLQDHPRLACHRVCGTIAAVNVVGNGESGYLSAIGPALRQRFLDKGFLLRPLGNVLYILPPYCITGEQIISIYECIQEVIKNLSAA